MGTAHTIQTAFNAGEFSPLMEGHINLEKRADAALLIKNLLPLKQGPLMRRGPTRFVKEVKDSSKQTALIPFEFSTVQAYQIETGDQYFRFYRNNAIITATAQNITGITQANPAVVTYDGSDTYSNGDEVYISGVVGMTQVNGKFFKVANVNTGANTFELQTVDGTNVNSTSYTAYSSGGTVAEVYTVTSPYTQANLYDADNLFQIMHAQKADVLYLIHGSYQPRALTRTGHASWTLTALEFDDGPYFDLNTTATTLTLSSTSGSVTVTASATTGINSNAGFATTDVGRLIRWKDPANNWTWLKITAWTSTTQVTATISGPNASAGTATTNWRLGVYSDTTGWPKAISFYQDRMVLAGASGNPERWDMSIPAGYSGTTIFFEPTEPDGTVTANNAVSGVLQSGSVNNIVAMSPDEKGLIIITVKQEWLVRPANTSEVFSQNNAESVPLSSIGGAYIKPIDAESGTIFVQRARRKFNDVIYSFEYDRPKPRDLTLAAEHITKTGVLGATFQKEPINCLWAYRGDGLLIGDTYYPDEKVFAWHRHPIGGSFGTGGAVVESVSVIPSADGTRDELWLIVKRTINGVTRRYVEYMDRYYEDDMALEDAPHMDSCLTYDGAATATVTGLEHLEGQTVKVMRDGKSHPDLVVANGSITLANSRTGSVIHVGLAAPWAFKSMQIEAGMQGNAPTAQGVTKRITGFVVRLLNTLGLRYGADSDKQLDEYDFNQGQEYDETPALFTGDTEFLRWPEGYETAGHIYLEHDGVFPVCILATMPRVSSNYK